MMKPILKWQYEQLVKELILLQEHQADPHCPCESDGEMCVRKHLLTIEAYAQETVAIEEGHQRRVQLQQIAEEATQYRHDEELTLCAGGAPIDVLDWSRNWRKEFEAYSLGCDVPEPEACPIQS